MIDAFTRKTNQFVFYGMNFKLFIDSAKLDSREKLSNFKEHQIKILCFLLYDNIKAEHEIL